LNRAANFNRVI